jgi:chorismate-pyruvate lyase
MTPLPPTSELDISTLNLLQRILVTTDGTVTDMLAAVFLEPIQLVTLDVTLERSVVPVQSLEVAAGATMMHRRIILRGEQSLVSYVYAETRIAADRLAPGFREDLLAGRTPLGQLWLTHRLETWKERPRVRRRQAAELAGHLNVSEDAGLIERRYRTFTGGAPVFDVTEFFPLEYPHSPAGR